MRLSLVDKLPMFEPIEIDWEDSVLDQSGWCSSKDYDFAGHIQAMQYRTTGYFLKKEANALFVCQSHRDDGQICGIMAIPFTAIKRVMKVK
jgi:hypothetical protein